MDFNLIYYSLFVLGFGIVGKLIYFKFVCKGKYSSDFIKRDLLMTTINLSLLVLALVLFDSVRFAFMLFAALLVYGMYLLYLFIKGRESLMKAICYLCLSCVMIPHYLLSAWDNFSSALILPMMLLAIGYISRNPWDSPYWYEAVITEVKKEIKSECTYTSRPIVLNRYVPFPFFVYYRGIRIWFKKGKVIFKISEKYYNELNKPELKSFATKLIDRILEEKYPTFDKVKYTGKNV